jgi:hypothetical protein
VAASLLYPARRHRTRSRCCTRGPDEGGASAAAAAAAKKRSKVEELMQRDLEAKKRRLEGPGPGPAAAAAAGGEEPSSSSSRGRLDHWLQEGVVIKVMSKALKEHGYYKQKVGARGRG